MEKVKKYIIILLIGLLAACCLAGLSTWIVTDTIEVGNPPQYKDYSKKLYLKNRVEYDAPGSLDINAIKDDLFVDEDGEKATLENGATITATISDGATTTSTVSVGGTYQVTVAVNNQDGEPGYEIAGYYDVDSSEIIPDESPKPILKYKSVDVGGTLYTIEDALNKATNKQTATVKYNTSFAVKDIADLAGYSGDDYYTVKGGATLLVPYGSTTTGKTKSGSRTLENTTTYGEYYNGGSSDPSRDGGFVLLTVTSEVNLTVKGKLVVNAVIVAKSNPTSYIDGKNYGEMIVKSGATITVTNGASFETMGYTRGDGTIYIENGAQVWEPFNITGYKGGTISSGIKDDLFPINQYTLASLVCKTVFSAGAKYDVRAFVGGKTLWVSYEMAEVSFLSDKSTSFLQVTSGKFTKWIDETTGEVHFEIDDNATVTFNNLSLSGIADTQGYQIPIAGHFTIEAKSGTTTIPKDVQLKLLPGAQVIIHKNATLNIASDGKLFGYGANNSSVSTFKDGGKAYPYDNTIAVYRVKPTLDYGADIKKYPAKVIVKGTLNVQPGATFAAEIYGDKEKSTFNLESGTTLSASITEDENSTASNGTCTKKLYTINVSTVLVNADNSTINNPTTGKHEYNGEQWIGPNTVYHVTYKLGYLNEDGQFTEIDGEANNPEEYTPVTGTSLNGAVAAEAKYSFVGWYLDEQCQQEISSLLQKEGDLTLYGKFDTVDNTTYQIQFSTGYPDSSFTPIILDSLSIKVDQSDFTPDETKIRGNDSVSTIPYTFVGWYLDAEYNTQFSWEALRAMYPTGGVAVILYAKWNIKTYTLKISAGAGTNLTVTVDSKQYSSGSIDVLYGAEVTYTVTANDGYQNPTVTSEEIDNISSPFNMPAKNVTIASSAESTGGSGPCLVEGTLITMADGTMKKVEDIVPGDRVLFFNHYTGQYESEVILYNAHAQSSARETTVINLRFADETTLRIVGNHGVFDLDLMRYVFINEWNAKEFIGHRFATAQCVDINYVQGVTVLVDVEFTKETVRYFSPMTAHQFNLVAEGLLTITTFTVDGSIDGMQGFVNYFQYDPDMKYNKSSMEEDIEKYGLYAYDDFKDYITEEMFEIMGLKYLKVSVGKGYLTWDEIMIAIDFILNSGEI